MHIIITLSDYSIKDRNNDCRGQWASTLTVSRALGFCSTSLGLPCSLSAGKIFPEVSGGILQKINSGVSLKNETAVFLSVFVKYKIFTQRSIVGSCRTWGGIQRHKIFVKRSINIYFSQFQLIKNHYKMAISKVYYPPTCPLQPLFLIPMEAAKILLAGDDSAGDIFSHLNELNINTIFFSTIFVCVFVTRAACFVEEVQKCSFRKARIIEQ